MEFISPEGLTVASLLAGIIGYLIKDKSNRDKEKAHQWKRFNRLEDFTIKFAAYAERAKIKGLNGPLTRDLKEYREWTEKDIRENK